MEAKRRGDVLHLDLAYPRTEGTAKAVEVELLDVRAADNVRISYDFERDGWVVQQASRRMVTTLKQPQYDESEEVEDWHEVAFLHSWALDLPTILEDGRDDFEVRSSTPPEIIAQAAGWVAGLQVERNQLQSEVIALRQQVRGLQVHATHMAPPTPEDVARDRSAVAVQMGFGLAKRGPDSEAADAALSRLATAAARVPGLEAERLQLIEQVGAATREAESCMAERNAATAELEAEQAGRLEFRKRFGALESETFGAFVERLASERDAARQEVGTLRAEVDAVLRAIPGAVRVREGGGPENIAASLAVTTEKFTARVAKLERERDAALESERHATDCFKEAEARATAAEAKVASARDAALSEAVHAVDAAFERDLDVSAQEVIRALMSKPVQPTPAPGAKKAGGP